MQRPHMYQKSSEFKGVALVDLIQNQLTLTFTLLNGADFCGAERALHEPLELNGVDGRLLPHDQPVPLAPRPRLHLRSGFSKLLISRFGVT